MQYTESEREAWRQVDSFFEPDGVLDKDACEKYYETHLSRKMEPNHIAHKKGELLFALMKKTIAMDQAKKTFARVYNAIRSVSPRLQIFLNHIAEKEPDVLRTWLKETSHEADITSQILLLRDVKLWLPHDDVGLYTNAAILKMKPSAFVKKFTPEVSDMATLLEVAQDFQTKPKYAHLGLLMQQGIFIALYGKEHEPRGFDENTLPSIGELLEIKYSARAAFDLMQSNGIRLPPSELMTLIKSRYRAQCLESDALAYAYESLNPDVSEEKREYGLQVLDTVLQAQTQRPDFLYNTGLLHIYAMMEKQVEHDNTEMMQRIKNALLHYIASDKMPARSMQEVITLTPSLTEELLDALQKRAEDHQNQKLLHALFMGGAYHDELYQGIGKNSFQHSAQLYGLAQKRSTAEQVTNLFEHQFNAILAEKSYDGSERDPSCVMGDLKQKTRIFVAHKWPLEKLEHLRNSTVVPKWVLTQLSLGACATDMPGLQHSVMPELNADPLPFLRSLYPEHNGLWNTMVKAMLSSEVTDLSTYTKQQTQLFNIFSSAFLPGKTTLDDVKTVSDAMGMTVLDYVVSTCDNAHALVFSELDANVFDLDI